MGWAAAGAQGSLVTNAHTVPVPMAQAAPVAATTGWHPRAMAESEATQGVREPVTFIPEHTRAHTHTLTHSQKVSCNKLIKTKVPSDNLSPGTT